MGLVRRSQGAAEPAPPPVPPASLGDPDPSVRRRAVQALGAAPDAAARLASHLREEPDASVRDAAFLALAGLGTRAAAEAAASLLTEPDAALRSGAFEALGAMPAEAAALLAPLGHHADPDVRSFAILLAADLPPATSGAWLIDLASREEDPNVAAHCADALGGTGLAEAAGALRTIAARFADQPFVRFTAETALRRLGEA
ncbi:MAG: HEAT repeat domain-containing protein [Erythrobacter sp.]